MRVVIATPRYAPEVGGVQRCVQEIARRVAAAGCEITVLTTDAGGTLLPKEKDGRITIRRVRARPAHRDYYFAPGIARIVGSGEWDLLHVQSYHTFVAPLAMLAAMQRRLPYLLTFHGGGHSSRLRNAVRGTQLAALRPLLKGADRLVATAEFEIDLYGRKLGVPPERFALIPNGGDLPRVTLSAPPAANGTTIASVGRLERYKGHHRILAALPHMARRRPDVHLWIAGSGSYENELRKLAMKLNVSDRVTIEAVPAGNPELLTARLANAALVVLLSEYETHPMAILEAATLGRPVLVADTSGLRELAFRGLGRAIPLRSDPTAVAAAALEELDRPSRPPHFFALPTWDECASAHLQLYKSIVESRA